MKDSIDDQAADIALPQPQAICLAPEAWFATKLSMGDKPSGQAYCE
jgi:hypothetical protein